MQRCARCWHTPAVRRACAITNRVAIAPAAWPCSPAILRASSRLSSLAAEHAGAGDNVCPGQLLPIIGWTEVAFEFCRVSRSDSQYCTNKSGPAKRKSCSTARRQKGLRPLSQACPSGGKRGKIDSKIGLGISVVFLTAAPSGGSVGLSSSSKAFVRSGSSNVTSLADLNSTVTALSVRAKRIAIRRASLLGSPILSR